MSWLFPPIPTVRRSKQADKCKRDRARWARKEIRRSCLSGVFDNFDVEEMMKKEMIVPPSSNEPPPAYKWVYLLWDFAIGWLGKAKLRSSSNVFVKKCHSASKEVIQYQKMPFDVTWCHCINFGIACANHWHCIGSILVALSLFWHHLCLFDVFDTKSKHI